MKRLIVLLLIVLMAVPVYAQEPKDTEERLAALESENAALRQQVADLSETLQAVATMLSANFATDCVMTNILGSLLELPQITQAQCMEMRIAVFDSLPTDQRPFAEPAPIQGRPGG